MVLKREIESLRRLAEYDKIPIEEGTDLFGETPTGTPLYLMGRDIIRGGTVNSPVLVSTKTQYAFNYDAKRYFTVDPAVLHNPKIRWIEPWLGEMFFKHSNGYNIVAVFSFRNYIYLEEWWNDRLNIAAWFREQ